MLHVSLNAADTRQDEEWEEMMMGEKSQNA
jgi:hypothetical protein